MALLDGVGSAPRDRDEAARAFEAMVIRQILAASGAFRGGEAGIEGDLFADALADQIAKAGGLGIAGLLKEGVDSMTPAAGSVTRHAPPPAPVDAAPFDPTDLTGGVGRVSSGFGNRSDPFDGSERRHTGIDVAAPGGSEIRAAADGIVRSSGTRGGYGNAVEIDHGNGVTTLYAHASELLVGEGTRVVRGQVIGRVGHTGRATGDHLHFEVRVGERAISPARALKAYGIGAE